MKKILLTTTESLQGWEIENYLKPIFSNVVLGAGLFSDISAGLNDLFGGRSGSYEKKLQSVNESALQILQSKASEIGANCIIGLKINVHQISGKNVQMFMVSAYGTAVIAKNNTAQKETVSLKEMDKNTLNDKAELLTLLKKFENKDFRPSLSQIQLIVDNRSSEFAPFIYQTLKRLANIAFQEETSKAAEKLCLEYFSLIPLKESEKVLYDALDNDTDEAALKKVILIIKSYDLLVYERCLSLLASEKMEKKKIALTLLSYDKAIYEKDDITAIKKVINKIENSFPILSTTTTKKGFLSSNEKEMWLCACQKSNAITDEYCLSCSNNQYGFKLEDIKPQDIVLSLNNKMTILNDAFQASLN